MVKKEECAWITQDGFCLWHKEPCCRTSPRACTACVRRVSNRQHAHAKAYLQGLRFECDSKKSIFKFKTRNVRGYDVYRACSRKRHFSSYNEAHEKAVYLNRRKGMILYVYECPFCGGYHLTKRSAGSTHVCGYSECERLSA